MINFIDLKRQQNEIRKKIETRIKHVLDHGQYIQGNEIFELQERLCNFSKANYTLCCSSGTDALLLGLQGLRMKPLDGVIVPSFTFASSAEAISILGGIPIFADVNKETFNLDPEVILKSIHTAKKENIKLTGIMTVGLFGQPCDMDPIIEIAKKNKIWVLDDAAQSFGGKYKNKYVGTLTEVTATSFFPAKPLGCYGDGGALFTNNKKIYDIAYSAHLHGMGKKRYFYDRIGMNGRMDTIQAAILLEKLSIFKKELINRQKIADLYFKYFKKLKTKISFQNIMPNAQTSWAQFTIVLPKNIDRDLIQKKLFSKQIPTAIYYPIPLHKQKPYKKYPTPIDGLKNTEFLSKSVLSLPMHPYLKQKEIEYISFNLDKIINKMIT